ncbi:MAG TPA: hypothetical protein VIY73_29225 [Polyangiaceae bacterium]
MTWTRLTSLAVLLAPLALAAACGGSEPAATEPTNPPPSAAPTETAPPPSAAPSASAAPTASAAPSAEAAPTQPGPGDWDKWTHDQKLAWMKAGVMPKMGALFASYDAKKYADAKCVLCHGNGAKDGSFKMPNPDLPKLPKTPADFKKLAAKHPKIFAFMKDQVEPQMASLLGEQPFDPATKAGFSCMGCHTQKQ